MSDGAEPDGKLPENKAGGGDSGGAPEGKPAPSKKGVAVDVPVQAQDVTHMAARAVVDRVVQALGPAMQDVIEQRVAEQLGRLDYLCLYCDRPLKGVASRNSTTGRIEVRTWRCAECEANQVDNYAAHKRFEDQVRSASLKPRSGAKKKPRLRVLKGGRDGEG